MELFHALNRGVEKRDIFLDNQDRARFVHNMYEFNDRKIVRNVARRMKNPGNRASRDQLVDIHGWCLMGNHYHLLLSERTERGLSQFLMRLNVGYAKYFNEKYKRSGTLFQSKTKRVLISSDKHFLHILHYIHSNPLDFSRDNRSWREGHIRSARKALIYLENYKWSSYPDYIGKKNFPSILTTSLFSDVLGNYQKAIRDFLRDREVESIAAFTLE